MAFSKGTLGPDENLNTNEFKLLTNGIVQDFVIDNFKKNKIESLYNFLNTSPNNEYQQCIRQCRIDYGGPRPTGNASCMKYICDKLGNYGCDSQGELMEVASMCTGIRNIQ